MLAFSKMPYPNRVFGQAMKKQSRYQRQFGGKSNKALTPTTIDAKAEEAAARKRLRQEQGEAIDTKFGYSRLEDQYMDYASEGETLERRGWLFNMLATTVR